MNHKTNHKNKPQNKPQNKLFDRQSIHTWVKRQRQNNKSIAFTNGCFDILHVGHLHCLQEAAKTADVLIVAVNSDDSVKRLKDRSRPINALPHRMQILAALSCVDAVVDFGDDPQDQDMPLDLIRTIQPDALIKGGDYPLEDIVGSTEVIQAGGKVHIIPFREGYSTTATIKQIQS